MSHDMNDIFMVVKHFKNMNATRVQRFMRGYLVRNKTMVGVWKERFWLNAIYFDEMKFKLWSGAAVIVQKNVRRWLVLTADERALRRNKKRKSKSKRKTAGEKR